MRGFNVFVCFSLVKNKADYTILLLNAKGKNKFFFSLSRIRENKHIFSLTTDDTVYLQCSCGMAVIVEKNRPYQDKVKGEIEEEETERKRIVMIYGNSIKISSLKFITPGMSRAIYF